MRADWILKYKWPILILFLAITAFFAPFAAKVKPNNSVEALGVVDDPALDLMHKLEKVFGSDEFISLSVFSKILNRRRNQKNLPVSWISFYHASIAST